MGLLQLELKVCMSHTWVPGPALGPSKEQQALLASEPDFGSLNRVTLPHITLKERNGDRRGCEPRLGLCTVRGGCPQLKLVTFYPDQRCIVVVRVLGRCCPAGEAEFLLGFCVSRRRIRQLWSSCCSPPRGCSSVLGCSSSTRARWRPVSAPSPWWVSNPARLTQCHQQGAPVL